MAKYNPKSKEELQKLVSDESVNLGDIDTSAITDMSYLFDNMPNIFAGSNSKRTDFSGIEKWDTSKVTNMESMFNGADNFNHNINDWNVSNVTNMSSMFSGSNFNHNINDWNVSSVEDMRGMFSRTPFNQPLNDWNVSNVTDMAYMFQFTPFNQPLDKWNVSKVEYMDVMFCHSFFNQNINDWNVSNVTDMSSMFMDTPFNKPLDKWNVSSVENMSEMFYDSKFNQNINNWNVSNVTEMSSMFSKTPFNQPLDKWNVSKVTSMSNMFRNTPFNQSLDSWSVVKVKDINGIFDDCAMAQLPSWYLKRQKDSEELLCDFSKADLICKKRKVAYIVQVDDSNEVCELLQECPSKLQAAFELKDMIENSDIRYYDKDFYVVIGYEPKEISVKDLEPLLAGMDIEAADWILRRCIQKAILFDNTYGSSFEGIVGKIFGVYNNRLEIIDMLEKETPKEIEKFISKVEGEAQCLGYQPKFNIEIFIGRDYLFLADALRWVEWLQYNDETYWWVEVEMDSGTIIRVVKEIKDNFDKAEAYKKELPLVEEGNAYILMGNSGKWVDAYGKDNGDDECDDDDDWDDDDYEDEE